MDSMNFGQQPLGNQGFPGQGMVEDVQIEDINASFSPEQLVPSNNMPTQNFTTPQNIQPSNPLNNISPEAAIALSASKSPQLSNLGNALLKNQENRNSQSQADRAFHTGQSGPFLQKLNDQRQAVVRRES